MRWLVVFLIAIAGCVASLPDDASISADLAVETAYLHASGRVVPPKPAPASDKCDNCNGTGKIGDGRIVMTCPVCGGTGKPVRSVLHPATFVPLVAGGSR